MSLSAIPRKIRETVFERDAGRCSYCRLVQFGQGAIFHIDHIVPRSKGGTTSLDNLALQCPNCSLHKADKIMGTDPTTGNSVPLFHPLRQSWPEQFNLDDDGSIVGLTVTGRATIVTLGMNAMIPHLARKCQIALGLLTMD